MAARFFEMPQASPTMEAGTILAWRKAEGDRLEPQDVVAEVETDKAAMEVEVFDRAVLLRILEPEGARVPAGRPIAILGDSPDDEVEPLLEEWRRMKAAGAEAADAAAGAGPAPAEPIRAGPAPAEPVRAGPAAPPADAEPPRGAGTPGLRPFRWMGRPVDPAIMEVPEGWADADGDGAGPVRAAPAARRAARRLGVELSAVRGTGPGGRITRADVERAARAGPSPAAAAPGREPEVLRITEMRGAIARRLVEAWTTGPQFTLYVTIDAGPLVQFRRERKNGGRPVSANDVIVRASALALLEVPEVNSAWTDAGIVRHRAAHVGVAVALEDGLVTPVVRDADRKGLSEISAEIRELAARARERRLRPEEYTGSTFTVSNLGMMGIERFSAIRNPPEACILSVGTLRREPVVDDDGEVRPGWRLTLGLSCDHRVVDGATGARFLQALRRLLENPALLAG